MKKLIVTLILVAGAILYVYAYTRRPSTIATVPVTSGVPADLNAAIVEQQALEAEVAALAARIAKLEGGSATANTSPGPAQTPIPVPTPKLAGQYKDGAYIGSVADAYYGNVQVQATVSGGRVTDVTFLSYPSDRSNSRYINSQATPILTQEAIAAQSANVDIVSGATDTSQAFIESLSTALAAAKA